MLTPEARPIESGIVTGSSPWPAGLPSMNSCAVPGCALALERLGLAGRLELEAQRVPTGRHIRCPTRPGRAARPRSCRCSAAGHPARRSVKPPSTPPCETSTPSAPPSGISTSAVMVWGRLRIRGRRAGAPPGCRGSRCSGCGRPRSAAAPRRSAAGPRPSTGRTLYLPASTYHCAIISISRGRFSVGDVVVLGDVLGDVVQLPAGGVELGQHLGRDRRAELAPRLGERRCPATGTPPASRRGRSSGGPSSRSTG